MIARRNAWLIALTPLAAIAGSPTAQGQAVYTTQSRTLNASANGYDVVVGSDSVTAPDFSTFNAVARAYEGPASAPSGDMGTATQLSTLSPSGVSCWSSAFVSSYDEFAGSSKGTAASTLVVTFSLAAPTPYSIIVSASGLDTYNGRNFSDRNNAEVSLINITGGGSLTLVDVKASNLDTVPSILSNYSTFGTLPAGDYQYSVLLDRLSLSIQYGDMGTTTMEANLNLPAPATALPVAVGILAGRRPRRSAQSASMS